MLKLVLKVDRDAGIKLNAEKTCLFKKKVEYFGFVVSEDGSSLIPSYVEKVLEWTLP